MIKILYLIVILSLDLFYYVNANELVMLAKNDPPKSKWIHCLMILQLICYGISGLGRITSNVTLLTFITLFIAYFLLFFIMLLNHRKKLASAYCLIVFLSLDSICQSIVGSLTKYFDQKINIILVAKITSLQMNLLLFILLQFIFSAKSHRMQKSIEMIPAKIYVLVLICLLVFSELCAGIQNTYTKNNASNLIIIASIIFICPTLFVITSLLFSNCLSKQFYKSKISTMNKQIEIQLRHYYKLNKYSNELREFRHDYKNHILCINNLLKSNQIEMAKKYLSQISSTRFSHDEMYHSGNLIVDSILSDKNDILNEIGGEIVFKGKISDKFRPIDISTILFNALDNAIEAIEKLDKDKDDINIEVTGILINNMQNIIISNTSPYPHNYRKTSKADKINHGFGLTNINRTVTNLEGEMKISQQYPKFVLEVFLPVN